MASYTWDICSSPHHKSPSHIKKTGEKRKLPSFRRSSNAACVRSFWSFDEFISNALCTSSEVCTDRTENLEETRSYSTTVHFLQVSAYLNHNSNNNSCSYEAGESTESDEWKKFAWERTDYCCITVTDAFRKKDYFDVHVCSIDH